MGADVYCKQTDVFLRTRLKSYKGKNGIVLNHKPTILFLSQAADADKSSCSILFISLILWSDRRVPLRALISLCPESSETECAADNPVLFEAVNQEVYKGVQQRYATAFDVVALSCEPQGSGSSYRTTRGRIRHYLSKNFSQYIKLLYCLMRHILQMCRLAIFSYSRD
jgi:hypothetical protein